MSRNLYRHSQTGKLWLVALLYAVVMIITLVLFATLGEGMAIKGVITGAGGALAVVVIMFVFSRLTVTVDKDLVTVAFGAGWPRKQIVRSKIVSHQPVRNSWLLGWGIRWFKGGRMWNVWGLEAVELELTTGKKFRIGTDEPMKLDAALATDTDSGHRRR